MSQILDKISFNTKGGEYILRSTETLPISYSDLISKRNNGELVPGMWYRITDYHTTTTLENTSSADHPFEILVQALTENTLSEDAKAYVKKLELLPIDSLELYSNGEYNGPVENTYEMGSGYFSYTYGPGGNIDLSIEDNYRVDDSGLYISHRGFNFYFKPELEHIYFNNLDYARSNVYFSNSNLSAWEIKYCLDNDTDRFAWASPEGYEIAGSYFMSEFLKAYDTTITITRGSGSTETIVGYVIGSVGSTDIIIPKAAIDSGEGMYYYKDMSANTWEISGSNISYVPGGKGVIYYMKDEFGNEAGYDFKNIQFKNLRRFSDSFVSKSNADKIVDVEALDFSNSDWFTTDSVVMLTESNYKYTFSKGTADASLNSTCRYNIIENTENASESATKQYLPFVVLESDTGAIHGNKCLLCPINIYVHVSGILNHNTFDLHCKNVYICGDHLYDSHFSALLRMAFRGYTWDIYVQSCEDWVIWSSSHCKNNHFRGVCQKYKIVCTSMQNVHVLGTSNVINSLMPSAYLLAITLYPYSNNITFTGNATWIERFTFMGSQNLTLNIDSSKVYSSIFYPGDYTDKAITEFNRTESHADTGVTYEYKPNNSTTIIV